MFILPQTPRKCKGFAKKETPMKPLFSGVATALITPFRDGKIDFESLDRLLSRQTEAGIPAVVISGTTGESPSLTYAEYETLLRFSRAHFGGVLVAGCGANCTARALELARIAAASDVDALLAVTPYYNKASRAGLVAHYRALSSVGKSVIVYHVPSRTGLRLTLDDYRALAAIDGVCGVKEASGDLSLLHDLAAEFDGRLVVWTGNDDTIRPSIRLGALGVVSVISNLLPRETAELVSSSVPPADPASSARSLSLHRSFAPLVRSLFSEVNPIPVKYVASLMGLCAPEYRLPLTPPSPETQRALEEIWGK